MTHSNRDPRATGGAAQCTPNCSGLVRSLHPTASHTSCFLDSLLYCTRERRHLSPMARHSTASDLSHPIRSTIHAMPLHSPKCAHNQTEEFHRHSPKFFYSTPRYDPWQTRLAKNPRRTRSPPSTMLSYSEAKS